MGDDGMGGRTPQVLTREKVISKISNMRNDPRDRAAVVGILKVYGWSLRFAPRLFRCDREAVEWALRQHGRALEYAHPDLRDSYEVVELACQQDGMSLPWATERLRSNKDIVMIAVTGAGAALEFASLELRKDEEVVLEAVKNDGAALMAADESLRADREFVMRCVRVNRHAIDFAAPALRSDPLVQRAAFGKGDLLPGLLGLKGDGVPFAPIRFTVAPEARLDRVFGGGGGPRPPLRFQPRPCQLQMPRRRQRSSWSPRKGSPACGSAAFKRSARTAPKALTMMATL